MQMADETPAVSNDGSPAAAAHRPLQTKTDESSTTANDENPAAPLSPDTKETSAGTQTALLENKEQKKSMHEVEQQRGGAMLRNACLLVTIWGLLVACAVTGSLMTGCDQSSIMRSDNNHKVVTLLETVAVLPRMLGCTTISSFKEAISRMNMIDVAKNAISRAWGDLHEYSSQPPHKQAEKLLHTFESSEAPRLASQRNELQDKQPQDASSSNAAADQRQPPMHAGEVDVLDHTTAARTFQDSITEFTFEMFLNQMMIRFELDRKAAREHFNKFIKRAENFMTELEGGSLPKQDQTTLS